MKKPHMFFYEYFLVCRNPYDIILSEFHCKWGGVGMNIDNYTKKDFNNYIRKKILNMKKSRGHYMQQYKYIPPFFIKCYIIKFENLENEFNNLMKKKKINIKLENYDNKNNKKFTIEDITKKNILLINKIYDKDFYIFGYDKININ